MAPHTELERFHSSVELLTQLHWTKLPTESWHRIALNINHFCSGLEKQVTVTVSAPYKCPQQNIVTTGQILSETAGDFKGIQRTQANKIQSKVVMAQMAAMKAHLLDR